MISLGKWCRWTIMWILLIFLYLLLLLLILLMLMFSGGWLQAIVTHWSVPVHFEQLSCHHHKTLSKFLVQPPYPPKKSFCTFALQNLQDSHCQIFGGFPMVYFIHFWNQTFHIQRLLIWYTEFSLQKTRSLVNLSEWSALSILIHRALVTQSSPPKVLLDVWAFGIISSDQGAKDLSCFVDQGYMTSI